MGEVYLCLDLEEMQPYALKTFQQCYVTDMQRLRKAFEQEVATWIALEKHPNIVRCFWMQTFDYRPFMCLEWIAEEEGRGTDLRGWLRHGPLDLKLALQIAIDLCNGMLYAQTKQPGLVHRDLKPENILMAQGGVAKITDFGLAQIAAEAELAVSHEGVAHNSRQSLVGGQGITGTPAYMAPEQWRGEALDERTDIYALGCILYELLTGSLPFPVAVPASTPNRDAVWLRTLQQAHEQAPVGRLPRSLPEELNAVVQRCLAKAPSIRYADMSILLDHLQSVYQATFHLSPHTQPTLSTFTVIDYHNRGATYNELGQHKSALADYNQAITIDPTFAQVYVNRGATYTDLGQYEAALADFAHAIHLDPNAAKVYVNRGVAYAALSQYEAALADYTHALSIDPNLPQAYLNRGVTFANLGEYDAAMTDYTQAISLDSNLAQAYSNRGNIYQELGQHDAALVDFNRAISLDPDYAEAYYNRGITYKTLGQYEVALANYNHALQINPNFAQAYANRASIFQLFGQYEGALADLNHALTLDPNLATVYGNRGLAYAELEQHAAALTDYDRAIVLDPTDAQTYYNRGVTHIKIKKYEAALTDYNYAIRLNPDYAKAYCNRGTVHRMLELYSQALADYGQAIELNDSYADAYLAMGSLLVKLDHASEALPYLEKATQLGHPKAAQLLEQVNQALAHELPDQLDPIQPAFEAFQQADSLAAMEQAVARFPLLLERDFIRLLAQIISEQIQRADRPPFIQRLSWLRQIANTQSPKSDQ